MIRLPSRRQCLGVLGSSVNQQQTVPRADWPDPLRALALFGVLPNHLVEEFGWRTLPASSALSKPLVLQTSSGDQDSSDASLFDYDRCQTNLVETVGILEIPTGSSTGPRKSMPTSRPIKSRPGNQEGHRVVVKPVARHLATRSLPVES